MKRQVIFAFIVLGSISMPALAEDAGKFAAPAQGVAVNPAAGMAQSLLALALVIAVLFALVWLFRRLNLTGPGSARGMSVLQGISVGPKERAVVIQVDGQRLLLGVAPGQVTLLKELAPQSDAESATQTVATPGVSFKDIFKRSLGISTTDGKPQ